MNPAPPVTHALANFTASPLSPEQWEKAVLPRAFYQADTVEVARQLLGKLLVRRLPEGVVAVRLSEVEAYLGVEDPAAHTAFGRRTPRNEVMWGDGGHLYVYFTYGMHHCANVVTRHPGDPQAVLLRGAVAVWGQEHMLARRGGKGELNGPAKLCQALALTRSLNGYDLTSGGEVFLADDGVRVDPQEVLALPRVGVDYAGEAAFWPLRYLVRGFPGVKAAFAGGGAGLRTPRGARKPR